MKSSRFTSRDERSVEIPFTENISYKQARNAVFVAIVLGILFSLAQIVLDLRNEKNSVATAVHQILSTAKDTAAEAAFNLDKELGQRTINGLLAYQPIFKATIRDELGAVIAHGEHTHTPVGPHYILHFLSDFTFGDVSYFTTPLILTGDRDIPAGEMTVWADAHVIAANFLGRVWMVLVFGLLRNIILALILTGVFFLTFTKPLVQSVNALRAIRRPTEQELFQAPVPKGHERDEIGQLVQSINALTADIHESEERFKDLAMHSIQGIVVHRNQKPLFANEAAARIFGFDSHDEILSLDTLEQSIAPHERERIAGYIEKRMSGEQAPETYEFEGRRVDGRGVWILNTVRVIDWKGEPAHQLTFLDITERKRAEEERHESEQRFRSLVENAVDAIFLHDIDGQIVDVNNYACRNLGYTREELLSMTVQDVERGAETKELKVLWKEMNGGNVAIPVTLDGLHQRKNGVTFPVEVRLGLFDVAGCPQFIVMARDVTERRQVEQALQKSEKQLLRAESIARLGHWRFALDDEVLDLSPELCRLFGYDPATYRPTVEESIARYHPDDQAEVRRLIGGSIETGQGFEFEVRMVRTDDVVRDVYAKGECEFGEDGKVAALFGIFQDITEDKQMERQLLHAQKMEAVGQLTGGIAHDFNNLLQIVVGNVGLAQFELEEGGKASAYLDVIGKAAAHGGILTQQLLAFSRKQTLSPITVDPNGLVEGILKILERTLGEDIEIETSLEDDIPSITVDTSALENAVLNLAINARAAMPEGGKLTVASGRKRMDEDLAIGDSVLLAGDYVEISLTDTGCGMLPEVLERAVEPFFTTREVGEGSGLGLSMVFGFAEQSGGHLFIESEPEKGTTVRIVLPVAEEAAGTTQDALPKMETGRGSGTILVVEDDPDVRATAMALLKTFGYEVREAQDAVAALEVLKDDDSVDLLFTDVVMPKGMNGFQLAQEASRRYPGLRVVLTSGYPEIELEKVGLQESGFTLLKKPYSQQELTDALKSIIGA